MYNYHYKLMFEPFSQPLYSEFFWAGENQKAALGGMRKNILANNEGVILLIGEEGHGKTTLVDILVSRIQYDINIGRVTEIESQEKSSFLQSICKSFGLNVKAESKIDFFLSFTNHLTRMMANTGKKSLLIIENGQLLTKELLADLAQIAGLEYNGRKLVSILLVGNKTLMEMIESSTNSILKNNLLFLCKTNALSQKDTNSYIKYRLKIAGNSARIFTDEAMARIFELTEGNLDEINALCTKAIVSGSESKKEFIDTAVINSCAGLPQPEELEVEQTFTLAPEEEPVQTEEELTEQQEIKETPETKEESNDGQQKKRSAFIPAMALICLVAGAGYFFFPQLTELYREYSQTGEKGQTASVPTAPATPEIAAPSQDPQQKQPKVSKQAVLEQPFERPVLSQFPTPTESHSLTDSIRIQPLAVKTEPVVVTAVEHSLTAKQSVVPSKEKPSQWEQEATISKAEVQPIVINNPVKEGIKPEVKILKEALAKEKERKEIKPQSPLLKLLVTEDTPPEKEVVNVSTPKIPEITAAEKLIQAQSVKVFHTPPKQLLRLEAKPNSDFVTDKAMEELKRYASLLAQSSKTTVLIEGFIASDNDTKANTQLSKRRANIVKDYMLKAGVLPSQLSVRGRGNNKPLASNATPTGRKKNRRIEISIVNDPTPVTP